MKPDYAKATAELMERLRRNAGQSVRTTPAPTITGSGVIINAPRDCVFYITPTAPQPSEPEPDA